MKSNKWVYNIKIYQVDIFNTTIPCLPSKLCVESVRIVCLSSVWKAFTLHLCFQFILRKRIHFLKRAFYLNIFTQHFSTSSQQNFYVEPNVCLFLCDCVGVFPTDLPKPPN